MLGNEPQFLEAMLACRRLGAYFCSINWHFKCDETGFIVRDSGAKVVVIDRGLLGGVRSALPEGIALIEAEGWAAWRDAHTPLSAPARTPRGGMTYTSGTTGRPKGVRRAPPSEAEQKMAVEILRIALGINPGMRALVSAPLYHSAPAIYGLQALLGGEFLVLGRRFDAEATLALVERHRLTSLYVVPTMYVRLLNLPAEVRSRYDISSVRFIASTGSPCAPDLKHRMIEWWGPVINECYASSETGWVTFIDSHESLRRPGSVGRPLGNARVKILDHADQELPPGKVGMIYVRQPATPDFTYNNNPAARAAIERAGLLCVGDMGYLDAEGYLYVTDRKSDMVISGGVNIYPAEIEAVLATMPGVADCAVFGIPDAEFGESVAAAVQPNAGAALTVEAVQEFVRSRIAGYKVPRVVAFHEALPREDSGKIFKRLLREPYWRDSGRKI